MHNTTPLPLNFIFWAMQHLLQPSLCLFVKFCSAGGNSGNWETIFSLWSKHRLDKNGVSPAWDSESWTGPAWSCSGAPGFRASGSDLEETSEKKLSCREDGKVLIDTRTGRGTWAVGAGTEALYRVPAGGAGWGVRRRVSMMEEPLWTVAEVGGAPQLRLPLRVDVPHRSWTENPHPTLIFCGSSRPRTPSYSSRFSLFIPSDQLFTEGG